MWVVLCSSNDPSAIWAHTQLKAAGLTPIELVTSEMLAAADKWEHRLGMSGVDVRVRLRDGRELSSENIRGVLNRLTIVSASATVCAIPDDRDYALQEQTAFYISWLRAIGRTVVNPPGAQGLCGTWRYPAEWTLFAGRAGLPAPPHRESSDDPAANYAAQPAALTRVIALGSKVFGASLPSPIAAACCRLAHLSRTPLLGIDLTHDSNKGFAFVGAVPLPDLRLGGPDLMLALAKAMRSGVN